MFWSKLKYRGRYLSLAASNSDFLPDDPSHLLLILYKDSTSTEQYYQILPILDNSLIPRHNKRWFPCKSFRKIYCVVYELQYIMKTTEPT